MSVIQWDQSLSLGLPEMDRQHQKWIGMMNDLNNAMKEGKGKDVLGRVLSDLFAYTRTHFEAEETFFDRLDYAEAAAHKKMHVDFVNKITAYKRDYDRGKVGLSVEVMVSLTDWLQKHIKSVDKGYAALAREKAA